ncbi:rhamnan synthesis F family protein [Galbitalea sp. SE-J8]|uniref:rhamnan synthesis F family protein n=1 Tax=Galbitalea sp. SE-J8 TaxID=3054952 RepID=UPI00259CA9A2|nr:rhamnan synthesis F family protein [Galbitalea sp. SE-J8]MDM4762948.1 rhamnan synthesis F family protein [Galbitalea sp. SE-J8]
MAPRVLDLARGSVRVEPGSHPLPVGADRVAVVTHYAPTGRLSRSVVALCDELLAAGYRVVLSSACDDPGDLDWGDHGLPAGVAIVRKPNVGYDFGSVAVALDVFPEIAAADSVLVVNDSNIGPFGSLAPLIADFEGSTTDAWGATSSTQHGYHLQSFFLGFRGAVLASDEMRAFWSGIEHLDDKREIIGRYEVGLSRVLQDAGRVLGSAFSAARFGAASTANLSLEYWLEMLLADYPFVKRELVRRPGVVPTAAQVPAVVRRLYAQDVREWM